MTARFRPPALRLAATLLAATALAGCNMLNRLADVGSEPQLSEIKNPTQERDYKPVSMPMPSPVVSLPNPNSLWRPGARAFFKDQRAADVGDILTVVVNITDDKATLNNETTRDRDQARETANLTSLLGYEGQLSKILPQGINPATLVDFGSDSTYTGTGVIDRDETIKLRLAAVIIQVLPNGNLVIAGRQEIRVNFEVRELSVTGVIRSQDIASDNSVNWDKIAEARISYGGRGSMSDLQQPRYGQQVFDIIFPF
ncbi:MAG: flagellar basal body L-ring protein FlgH [Alphaproteobacteria bacterium]|nr:flagellar basal body L-ring protein FlgH [Alphaproteobacteria bacterium]MBF0130553.1 flagellar basal body L-ring protein FlgH [Alphaproteobacteria bacterium]